MLFTTTLRLDQPLQLYDPARGDFNEADFPSEFGVTQTSVSASSPIKEGDVLLEQGVADTRALLARAMEERFLHKYAYKPRTDERSWWCVICPPPPHTNTSCSFSLTCSLVFVIFVACAASLALHVSPRKILKYTTSFCVEKY